MRRTDISDLTFFLFFFSLGIGSSVYGYLVRIGKVKSWWLIQSTPFIPEATSYLGMPFSLSSWLLAFVIFLPDKGDRLIVFNYLGIPLIIIAFVLAAWRPRWLTPDWLLWLEDNHGDLVPMLQQEAREMGADWSRRIQTQADLEAWVEEVRARRRGRT